MPPKAKRVKKIKRRPPRLFQKRKRIYVILNGKKVEIKTNSKSDDYSKRELLNIILKQKRVRRRRRKKKIPKTASFDELEKVNKSQKANSKLTEAIVLGKAISQAMVPFKDINKETRDKQKRASATALVPFSSSSSSSAGPTTAELIRMLAEAKKAVDDAKSATAIETKKRLTTAKKLSDTVKIGTSMLNKKDSDAKAVQNKLVLDAAKKKFTYQNFKDIAGGLKIALGRGRGGGAKSGVDLEKEIIAKIGQENFNEIVLKMHGDEAMMEIEKVTSSVANASKRPPAPPPPPIPKFTPRKPEPESDDKGGNVLKKAIHSGMKLRKASDRKLGKRTKHKKKFDPLSYGNLSAIAKHYNISTTEYNADLGQNEAAKKSTLIDRIKTRIGQDAFNQALGVDMLEEQKKQREEKRLKDAEEEAKKENARRKKEGLPSLEEEAKAILDSEMPPLEEEEQEAAGSRRGGLMTSQIDKLMTPWMKKGYLGTFAIDQVKHLDPNHKKFGFVMNLDPSQKKGSHWVAVFIDTRHDLSVEYYDSFGDDPPKEFLKNIKILIDRLGINVYLKMKVNKIVQQHANSKNCGWFAARFLMHRLSGKDWKFCSGYRDLDEKGIKKFKKKFEFI